MEHRRDGDLGKKGRRGRGRELEGAGSSVAHLLWAPRMRDHKGAVEAGTGLDRLPPGCYRLLGQGLSGGERGL